MPTPKPNAISSSAALTRELRKLATETLTIDGKHVTREQHLAKTIWDMANGWMEVTRDNDGNKEETWHPPIQWAMQLVFERIEGKAAAAQTENVDGVKAADKVRELVAKRLNKLADEA